MKKGEKQFNKLVQYWNDHINNHTIGIWLHPEQQFDINKVDQESFYDSRDKFLYKIQDVFDQLYTLSSKEGNYWKEGSLKGLKENYHLILKEFLDKQPDQNEAGFICNLMDNIKEAHEVNTPLLLECLIDDKLEIYTKGLNKKLEYLNLKLHELGYISSKSYKIDFDSNPEEFGGYYVKTVPIKIEVTKQEDRQKYKEIKDYHFTAFQAAYLLEKTGLINRMYNAGLNWTQISEITAGLTSNHPKTMKDFVLEVRTKKFYEFDIKKKNAIKDINLRIKDFIDLE